MLQIVETCIYDGGYVLNSWNLHLRRGKCSKIHYSLFVASFHGIFVIKKPICFIKLVAPLLIFQFYAAFTFFKAYIRNFLPKNDHFICLKHFYDCKINFHDMNSQSTAGNLTSISKTSHIFIKWKKYEAVFYKLIEG